METTDITIQILGEIRDEIRATREDLGARIDETNTRLDQTNARLDHTNARLDQTDDRVGALHQHIVGVELRVATALTELGATLGDIKGLLIGRDRLEERVSVCEQEIGELKRATTHRG